MGYFPCILSWISFSLHPVDLIQAFCQHWKERLTDDYQVLFYFGVRVDVEDANERIFLWGQMQTGYFSFGVRIGVEDAKSLDLLHDFSLSVQTCLSFFFCVQADAFCTWKNAVAKAVRQEKSPEIAQLSTQSRVFFKRRINEIFVNY